MIKHLKDKQYYVDLYDRHTVYLCRRWDIPLKDSKASKDSELSKEQVEKIEAGVHKLMMYFKKGERYANKDKVINEWMENDRKKDEMYESAQAPENIRCLTCRNKVIPTFKELWSESDKPDRVLFMYDCPNKCLPRRSFFSDDEEWRTKPNLCPNCDIPVTYTESLNDKLITLVYGCDKCGYKKEDKIDLTPKEKEDDFDPNFAIDRDRYCITDEEGKEYEDAKWRLEGLSKIVQEWKEEEKARLEKLKEFPKGYHLDGNYSCAICHNSQGEGNNWYDQHGIKCLICQKAIDEGEVPPTVANNAESWYSYYDLEKTFNLKKPTVHKWVKEGILKMRTISLYGKGSHYDLFLIPDNESFLPPKEMVKSEFVNKKDKDGKIYSESHPWYHFVDPMEHLKGYKIMDHLRVVKEEPKSETENT